MLISAGYVPLIFDLECLHRAANVHVRRGLYRIANRHVANDGGRLAVIERPEWFWYQVHDVQFVSHKFLKIDQEIVRMTKLQRDRAGRASFPHAAESETVPRNPISPSESAGCRSR